MSKNITIKKKSETQTFNGVAKIRLAKPNGETEDWLPEDECELSEISITQNGIYTAQEIEAYGIGKATVNVPKESYVSGKGKDGKYYKVTAVNSVITRTEIPQKMQITTSPTKTSYVEGEAMDYTGLVVTLYGGDEQVFTNADYSTGQIPSEELMFVAEVAVKKKTTIPVYWINPYTNRVLRATFQITVTEASDG